ncbi:hypothetical protein AB1E18_003284 [Capra hircus]
MNSSGNNEKFEGSTSRPFFYVPLMAQQPRVGPWYRDPACNPLFVSGAGLLKHRLCKQLQSSGRPLPLQPEALESRHCSAFYPRY